MGTTDGKLRQALPQVSVVRLASCLPRIFEHLVGVERAPGIEQSLRLVQRLLGRPHLTLALSRHPLRAIGQRATEFVTGSRITRAPGRVAVTIHAISLGHLAAAS
jgi:hypothetical protein